ncbi:pyridoxamine 5'-phosphate oxidase family protein [Actinokineospora diospyrosa]|uniref:PPOX class probable F420-dependent enzyme n=1 Tax=Actinokineospora diospyrosa TaxID=103728 RepID=A0ABT1I5G1_9PSEU|nr:pyridoxamine 5'-phosphate oxidase family protein [Actinokineospora diospyrosa]MCP2267851.1 PPOX class probable F420-dependent enzyme [Actinokineospora diospyrosa]
MAGKGFNTETGLAKVAALASTQDWLAVLVTQRADGDPATSVVNVGLVAHPVTGERVLALVSRGNTTKLRNLRRTPKATLVFRSGWDWISVTGAVEIAGPDDAHAGVSAERLPTLLREIYTAAGGQHDDFAVYDREMAADRRAAVFVRPDRFTSNPTPHDRED